MIIHSSFIRNVWISATPSACVTLTFTYPHVLTLLTSWLPVIRLSLSLIHTFLMKPGMKIHQASYLVSSRLIFLFKQTFHVCYLLRSINLTNVRILCLYQIFIYTKFYRKLPWWIFPNCKSKLKSELHKVDFLYSPDPGSNSDPRKM